MLVYEMNNLCKTALISILFVITSCEKKIQWYCIQIVMFMVGQM